MKFFLLWASKICTEGCTEPHKVRNLAARTSTPRMRACWLPVDISIALQGAGSATEGLLGSNVCMAPATVTVGQSPGASVDA